MSLPDMRQVWRRVTSPPFTRYFLTTRTLNAIDKTVKTPSVSDERRDSIAVVMSRWLR